MNAIEEAIELGLFNSSVNVEEFLNETGLTIK